MCGITGFAGAPGDTGALVEKLARMCGSLRHRGPDDEGRVVLEGGTATGSVGLGMRRLAIIDVARGQQPIYNEDGTVAVVFNGEIYNHRELQADLERRGHAFRTHSDTETLVHLWEERGPQMVHALRGMFTFAIWDGRRQVLFLARDRIGIKPLYLWPTPWGVAFASELRAFLSLPEFPRELSSAGIASYLSLGYVADPHCIFAAAEKLPPGWCATWSRNEGLQRQRYWTPVRAEMAVRDDRELIEELRRLLDDAVRSHLESEVPLGAFLSGGIDSSTVVALMARAMDRPVQTFSIGFAEDEWNEAPDAAAVAAEIGTDHTELILRPDADAILDDVLRGFDEPFADESAIPTYVVSRLARQSVTVSLSGDGGDELFAGYTRYFEVLGNREVPGAPLRALIGGAARSLPHSAFGRNRLLNYSRTREGRYASTVALPLQPSEGGVARPEIARYVPALDGTLTRWFDQTRDRDFASQITLVDMLTYLPGDILTKVDRMSMAVSLEARVPVLDHHLIEFAAALPSRVKYRAGGGKWLLRQAIQGLVPERVLTKRKQGFGVPIGRWFRGELRYRLDALARPDSAISAWTDHAAVLRVIGEHLRGRRDHQTQLWRLVMLEGWCRSLSSGATARDFQPGSALEELVVAG